MTVALPQRPDKPLRMVVVKGFGERPMLLLTTLARTTSRKSWQVVEGYLTRWRVEDAIRFIKQSYNLRGHPGPDVPAPEKHGRSAAGRHLLQLRLAGRTLRYETNDQHHPRRQAHLRRGRVPPLRRRRRPREGSSRATGNGTATSRGPQIKPRSGLVFLE